MRRELEDMRKQLDLLSKFFLPILVNQCLLKNNLFFYQTGRPPAFSCYKSSPQWNEGVVSYTRCNIVTEGMDRNSGVFTVKEAGGIFA